MLIGRVGFLNLQDGEDFTPDTEALRFVLEVIRRSQIGKNREHSAVRMEAIYQHIRDHIDEPLSVPDLAEQAGLSTPRFKARFKEETGVPPREYVLRAKIDEARRRLMSGRSSVTDVAFTLGFSSSQYFATVYKRYTGTNPSAVAGDKKTAAGVSLGGGFSLTEV